MIKTRSGGITMGSSKEFTQSEVEELLLNPYVANVISSKIYYTKAFKEFFMEKNGAGVRSVKVFEMAGFRTELLGKQRIYSMAKCIRREAASPEGLREPRCISQEAAMERLAKQDLSEKRTAKAIKELQERIVYLEQEIDFIKKIQILARREE